MILRSFRHRSAWVVTVLATVLRYASFAAEPAALQSVVSTLTGTWSGTWVDGRPGQGGGGGDFTCVATEIKPSVWQASFSLGTSKTFNVELAGVRAGREIHFDTTVDLGKFHGNYTIKGTITDDVFKATYSGKDEQGTFTLKRTIAKRSEP